MNFKNITHYLDDLDLKYAYDNFSDVLTRNFLDIYVNRLIDDEKPFAIFFCDIDFFKNINDHNGHLIGDKVLTDVSNAIIEATKDYGVVGRYGGDEYIIIAEGVSEYDKTHELAAKIISKVRGLDLKYFDDDDPLKHVSITMGCARYPFDANNYSNLLEKVDKALYRGKMKGRNCYIIYQDELHSGILTKEKKNDSSLKNQIDYIMNTLSNNQKSIDENLKTVLSVYQQKYNLIFAGINYDDRLESVYADNNLPHEPIKEEWYKGITYDDKLLYLISTRRYIYDINLTFYQSLKRQGIRSYVACKCECNGREYGIVRFDDKRERLWNDEEKTVVLTIAKMYAALKFYTEK